MYTSILRAQHSVIKKLISASIIHRPDTSASDRCLINVNPKMFAIKCIITHDIHNKSGMNDRRIAKFYKNILTKASISRSSSNGSFHPTHSTKKHLVRMSRKTHFAEDKWYMSMNWVSLGVKLSLFCLMSNNWIASAITGTFCICLVKGRSINVLFFLYNFDNCNLTNTEVITRVCLKTRMQWIFNLLNDIALLALWIPLAQGRIWYFLL